MTHQQLTTMVNQFCEGHDAQVDAAPDLTADELMTRLWEIDAMPFEEVKLYAADWLFALGKALRSGRIFWATVN